MKHKKKVAAPKDGEPWALVIKVEFHERSGSYIVTSPDLEEIVLVHDDVNRLVEALPGAIAGVLEERFGLREVIVVPSLRLVDLPRVMKEGNQQHRPSRFDVPWIAFTPHIAASAMGYSAQKS